MALDAGLYEVIPFLVNSAAATSSNFKWRGGYMGLSAKATFGSLQLNMIDPSGNVIPVGSAIVANSLTVFNLPEGVYQVVATGGSAYYVYGSPSRTRVRN